MVFIPSWQDFQDAAEALYAKAPHKARYCIKWNASERKLVLKITDDTTCIKFKTYSSIFLNRFEALNLSLMQKMQNRRQPASAPPPQPPPKRETDPVPGAAMTLPAATGPSAGGVTKKKKPKKKK